jgi:glycosyl transferase family 25
MSKNIDKIIYINLDKRTDRREQIEKELNDYDLLFERFPACFNIEGIVGCTQSHLNVLKLAKQRNYKNILILEDDFTFTVSKDVFEQQLTYFFDSNIDYDVCMISYYLNSGEPSLEYPFLTKVYEAQTASGYIVNSKYLDKLIDLYENAIPLLIKTQKHWVYGNDQCWKNLQKTDNWFCFTNRLGIQKDGWSDNSNRFMSYNC